MAENSSIEWTDHTFNPWIGCTRVSPGCDNCYAAAQDKFRGWTPAGWGGPRRRTSSSNWLLPTRWNANHAAFEALHGRRQRVFCASLGDVFDNQVPDTWRADLFALIQATPYLDWQLLTKRIANAATMLPWSNHSDPWPNVWVGATVVNREEVLRDGPKLHATRARIRFWSVEPLLEDLGEIPAHLLPDWVIVGGESGAGARPMDIAWATRIVVQCQRAGSRTFVKQLGLRPMIGQDRHQISDRKGKHLSEWPADLQIRQLPV